MAKEYISRERTLNRVFDLIESRLEWKSDARGEIQGLNAAYCAIEDIPAADVTPVRHGRWVDGKCDNCGEHAPYWCLATTFHESNYYPNCGADMREVQDDD